MGKNKQHENMKEPLKFSGSADLIPLQLEARGGEDGQTGGAIKKRF